MNLRVKITVALVASSLAAAAAIGVGTYTDTRANLNGAIDTSLDNVHIEAAEDDHYKGFNPGSGNRTDISRPSRRDLDRITQQFLNGNGTIAARAASGELPVDDADRRIAALQEVGVVLRRDIEIDNEPFRIDTVSRGNGQGAAQFARSLEEVQSLLRDLQRRTLGVVGFVMLLSATTGWLIGRQVTKRLSRLTKLAERVATTGALNTEVETSGNDETSRLAASFNAMLVALAASKAAQQQLVQDAGHELRTPLTSLRTNVSLLGQFESMTPQERTETLSDLRSETDELTQLVNELVELASDRHSDEIAVDTELAALVSSCAIRARRRTEQIITVRADTAIVCVQPLRLERAIANLIDNAMKFSPANTPIDIEVSNGTVTVSDRGPGVDVADQHKIFDRFYRAEAARSAPGSGLGLAIVKDIVSAHSGTVFVHSRAGGGASLGFSLPTISNRTQLG